MISDKALVLGGNLLVDSLAAEIFASLRIAETRAILLKGPSIARWLYEPGERTYKDVDVLVSPQSLPAIHRVLGELGFSSEAVYGPLDRVGSISWKRHGAMVDVHVSLNLLEQGHQETNWAILSAMTETMTIGGEQIPVLQPSARLVSLALHSLHDALECERYGFSSAQSRRDLCRAIASLESAVWSEAVGVASALGAKGEFASALRRLDAWDLADRLGLPNEEPRNVKIRAASIDGATESAALAADHLSRLSLLEQLAWLSMKLFPAPEYLRARSKLARVRGGGIVLAYLCRPFVISSGLRHLFAAFRATRRSLQPVATHKNL